MAWKSLLPLNNECIPFFLGVDVPEIFIVRFRVEQGAVSNANTCLTRHHEAMAILIGEADREIPHVCVLCAAARRRTEPRKTTKMGPHSPL